MKTFVTYKAMQKALDVVRKFKTVEPSLDPSRPGRTYRAERRNAVIREIRQGETIFHKLKKGGGGIWHSVYYDHRHYAQGRSRDVIGKEEESQAQEEVQL